MAALAVMAAAPAPALTPAGFAPGPAHGSPAPVDTVPGPAARSPAPADTVVQVWGTTVTATSGGLATVAIRLGHAGSPERPRRVRGRARFGPSLLTYESYAPGDAGGELAVDAGGAEAGVLTFELEGGGPSALPARMTLLELTFRVVAPPGGVAPVALELDALEEAGSGADLLGRTEVRDGMVLVR